MTGKNIQTDGIKVIKDDPHEKAFYIPFIEPSKPSERHNVTIEYDREEPDRQYGYNFFQQHNDFTLRLIAPKYLELNPAVHIVRKGETIDKTIQSDQQFISSINQGKVVLEWHSKDIPPCSVYRFNW